jgi:hypothetical protein
VSVRQALKSNVKAREHLDQAEELGRQLGWGSAHRKSCERSRAVKQPAIRRPIPRVSLPRRMAETSPRSLAKW